MSSRGERLRAIWSRLEDADRETLLAFAEFLGQRGRPRPQRAARAAPAVVPAPAAIERPAEESVVAALKRLSKTYSMLDKSEMLSATSDLVARHILQGGDTTGVIDRLEAVFDEHYRQLRERSGQ